MSYSTDWFTKNIPIWEKTLADLKGKPIKAVELGSYEGRSAVWMLENILTHPDASLTCVDSWKDGVNTTDLEGTKPDWKAVKANFRDNLEGYYSPKLEVYDGRTFDYLREEPRESVDLIYVDASHTAHDALIDGVLSHLILKPGGIIIFDDYLWGALNHAPNVPKGAIDAFMECFAEQYELLACGYQVVLRKKSETPTK
jgi:predicted O-methyltransferase YrrM